MMCVRMIVSDAPLFTSPVFAFLISQSMPQGSAWAGTFFLLICSIPAGLVIPILDKLSFPAHGRRHGHGKESELDFPVDGRRFWGTWMLSRPMDWMPFSYWARPYFMEPVYKAASKAGVGPEVSASTAVLAGHFMIWAGPATTMCQRKFIPDFLTCALIQPLGLMEDVAVVLATWAGSSPQSQKRAEMGLYLFMMAMNVAHWATRDAQKEATRDPRNEAAERAKDGSADAVTWQLARSHGAACAMAILSYCMRLALLFPDPAMAAASIPQGDREDLADFLHLAERNQVPQTAASRASLIIGFNAAPEAEAYIRERSLRQAEDEERAAQFAEFLRSR